VWELLLGGVAKPKEQQLAFAGVPLVLLALLAKPANYMRAKLMANALQLPTKFLPVGATMEQMGNVTIVMATA
jgi:hypothetical protein